MPLQRNRAIAPFADRLRPLIRPPLEPVPDRATCVGAGEHGHDRGDAQLGQPIRMRGVIGRQVDREPGFHGRGDEVAILDSDKVVAEHGLMVKAMTFLPVLAATSSSRSVPSICGPYPGRSPAWA